MKLGTRSKRIFVLLTLMSVMVLMGKAQTSMALYPLEDHFNSSDFNPAFLTSPKRFTLSVFPIGGTTIGYNNQAIIRQLVTKLISGDISDNDYIEVIRSLSDRTAFNQNAEATLLSFTYRSRVGFLNFRVKENQSFRAAFKGDLSDFIMKTGIQSAVISKVQDLPAQATHYREYSIGYSTPSKHHKFSAGIRAKLYFGKASFFSGISGSILTNQSGKYALNTYGKAKVSIPVFKILNDDGTFNSSSIFSKKMIFNYIMNSGNPGVGVDLGINYRINPALTFSMSIIDLGRIFWNSNLNSKSFNGNYLFEEGSIIPGVNDAGLPIITKTDSAVSFINPVSEIFDLEMDSTAFSSSLPVTIYTSMKYQLNSSLKICLVDKYVFLKNLNYNSFSMTANYEVNKKLSVSAGYAVIGNSYNNIPVALLFKKDFGQIYIGTDNLTAFFLPSISEFAGFTVGTCFYLFKKRTQLQTTTDDFPFYHLKKKNNYRNNGLINKENQIQ